MSVTPGARESVETWSRMLRDLRDQGLRAPKLVIAGGHLGIWGGAEHLAGGGRAAVLEGAPTKSLWTSWGTSEILNVLDQLPKAQHRAAKQMLRAGAYAPIRREAERKRKKFEAWCAGRSSRSGRGDVGRDWDRMMTFYQFPREHWVHIRTTNVVNSPFAALRLRTDAAKRFKRCDRVTAVIWKALMMEERHFRRLNAPHLLAKVYVGVRYVDGVEATQEVAA